MIDKFTSAKLNPDLPPSQDNLMEIRVPTKNKHFFSEHVTFRGKLSSMALVLTKSVMGRDLVRYIANIANNSNVEMERGECEGSCTRVGAHGPSFERLRLNFEKITSTIS